LVIAHPPCTYLAVSGLHWNGRIPGRAEKAGEAKDFFLSFTRLACPWAIENPIGCMSSEYRKPDQIIQPWQFGHDASKKTCLWLHRLPTLRPTSEISPRLVAGKKRWANQDDAGQNVVRDENGDIVGWNDKRIWKIRSRTYQGIADAMAAQWGSA
jgi:hypothetical protein